MTPLLCACQHGRLEIVKWLLETYSVDPHLPIPALMYTQVGRHDDFVLWNDFFDNSGDLVPSTPESSSYDNTLEVCVMSLSNVSSSAQGLSFGVLEAACVGGSLDTVKYLIDSCGFDVGRLRETLKFKVSIVFDGRRFNSCVGWFHPCSLWGPPRVLYTVQLMENVVLSVIFGT